jgi:hypothetical protein
MVSWNVFPLPAAETGSVPLIPTTDLRHEKNMIERCDRTALCPFVHLDQQSSRLTLCYPRIYLQTLEITHQQTMPVDLLNFPEQETPHTS